MPNPPTQGREHAVTRGAKALYELDWQRGHAKIKPSWDVIAQKPVRGLDEAIHAWGADLDALEKP